MQAGRVRVQHDPPEAAQDVHAAGVGGAAGRDPHHPPGASHEKYLTPTKKYLLYLTDSYHPPGGRRHLPRTLLLLAALGFR